MKFSVDLDADGPFAPGARITGTVRILEPAPCDRLVASLMLREMVVDSPGRRAVVRTDPQTLREGAPVTTGEHFPFAVDVPDDATPNIGTAWATVQWILAVSLYPGVRSRVPGEAKASNCVVPIEIGTTS